MTDLHQGASLCMLSDDASVIGCVRRRRNRLNERVKIRGAADFGELVSPSQLRIDATASVGFL